MRRKETSIEALPALADLDFEPRAPVALYLAGTVALMNVCATVLSLLA